MTDNTAPSLQFSTDAYSERDRIEAWRDLFGHTICGLDIEPLAGQPFQSNAVLRVLPGLGVADGDSTGAHYWRPANRIVSDDLVFVINRSGEDLARMSGREAELSQGEAVLFAADRIGGTTNAGDSHFTTLRMPRSAVANASDAILKTIKADNEGLVLLNSYLGILRDPKALQTPLQQQRIVSHIHDLITMAVHAAVHGDTGPDTAGSTAARMRAIKRDVALHATDSEIDIVTIARKHRVTPRYVQMLFAREETTFSDYLVTARLVRARAMLEDIEHSNKSIGTVALDAGFTTISYFNRAFRQAFNVTPSEVRDIGSRPAEKRKNGPKIFRRFASK